MKRQTYFLALLLLIACKNENTPSNGNTNLLSKDKTTVNSNSNITNCNYASLKQQIKGLNRTGIKTICAAENMVKSCLSSLCEADKDSAFMLFHNTCYREVEIFNDSLEVKYSDILQKIEGNTEDQETSNFTGMLDSCGLALDSEEGTYFVDFKPDYFYKTFKGMSSKALDEYLRITSTEQAEGFATDACLLISFDALYQRAITWEKFNTAHPNFFLKDAAQANFRIYLTTLLTGMDNSPIFDYETQKILPEIKKLYEKAIAASDAPKTTSIIAKYYAYLKTYYFRQPKSIEKFLKENNLHIENPE